MDIYIIRHGETDWNKAGRVQGQTDIELNAYGIELAELTAAALEQEGVRFDRVYTSPLKRAVRTAEILCRKSSVKPIVDSRITEISFGEAEGVTFRELASNPEYKNQLLRFKAPEQFKATNGAESFETVFARTQDFLTNELLPLENKAQKVLVSCHGGIARSLLMNITNLPLSQYWEIKEPNCAVNLVRLQDGKFSVVYTGKTYYQAEGWDASRGGIL